MRVDTTVAAKVIDSEDFPVTLRACKRLYLLVHHYICYFPQELRLTDAVGLEAAVPLRGRGQNEAHFRDL